MKKRIYVEKEIPMIQNLLEPYRKSDGTTKKKILYNIFTEKLIVVNDKVIAPIFTEPVKLRHRKSKSISNSKEKRGQYRT